MGFPNHQRYHRERLREVVSEFGRFMTPGQQLPQQTRERSEPKENGELEGGWNELKSGVLFLGGIMKEKVKL